jgi:hypothetical protein
MRKSITIAIVHKCFLPKLQLASKGRALFLFIHKWVMISRRRAHGISKEGAPSVEE